MNTDGNTNKKRILVVLTGGTICSKFSENDENVKVNSSDTGLILEKMFKNSNSAFKNSVEFRITESYGIFSENMTVNKWNGLINEFRVIPEFRKTAEKHGNYPSLRRYGNSNTDPDSICDGIIIAHGTDSLAYSAAMFSILLKNIGVPVFIVASNEALSSDRSNGADNFITAVECICMDIEPNVYVAYKNISDGKMYLHYASRLKQCGNYTEDLFSTGMTDISDITDADSYEYFKKLPRAHTALQCRDGDNNEFIVDLFDGDWQLKNCVLIIEPYIGLNYEFFELSNNVEAILHCTYHSGTVCSEPKNDLIIGNTVCNDYGNSIFCLINKLENRKLYISPADLSGNIYETTKSIINYNNKNVFFVNGFTKEMMYAKLLIAFSYKPLKDKENMFISGEYNHETVVEKN